MSYISEEAKTAFAWRVGILLAVCIILQFIVPLIIILVSITVLSKADISFQPLKAAFHLDGSDYIVTEGIKYGLLNQETDRIIHIKRLKKEELLDVLTIDKGPLVERIDFTIVTHDKKAWFFFGATGTYSIKLDKGGYFTFDGERVSEWVPLEKLGKNPKVAVWNNEILILSGCPCQTLRYSEGEWKESGNFTDDLNSLFENICCIDESFIAGRGEELHVFALMGDYYYHRYYDGRKLSSWINVSRVLEAKELGIDREGPFIFKNNIGCHIPPCDQYFLIYRFDGEKWNIKEREPVLEYGSHRAIRLGEENIIIDESGKAKIVSRSFQEITIYEIEGENISEAGKIERKRAKQVVGVIVAYCVAYLFPLLMSLIMAWGATVFMRRYRLGFYNAGMGEVQYASVIRRAIAQMVDIVILILPFAFVFGLMSIFYKNDFISFHEISRHYRIYIILITIIIFFIFSLFYFSIPEGLWGLTPGKMLMKIRVLGEDMKPCGIGRALLRNILKVVDGFFNFLVGIVVVAFTENWQRIGDLAARTIVIYEGSKSAINTT